MSGEERGGGAAQRALEHFEGELMFEGDWVPPTPFNGIAFLAAGAVLRHLHKRTQARGEPHARARPKRKKTRSRAPTAPPSLTPPTSPPAHPTTTEPRTPLSPVSIARPRQRTESRARTGAGGAGTDTNGATDGAVAEHRGTTALATISAIRRPSRQRPRPRPAGPTAVSAAAAARVVGRIRVVGQTRRIR